MAILFTLILLDLILTYLVSVIGAGMYFDKECYTFKIIYLIAVFTPFWNTYLAYKYITSDFESLKETIKFHFTWGK